MTTFHVIPQAGLGFKAILKFHTMVTVCPHMSVLMFLQLLATIGILVTSGVDDQLTADETFLVFGQTTGDDKSNLTMVTFHSSFSWGYCVTMGIPHNSKSVVPDLVVRNYLV